MSGTVIFVIGAVMGGCFGFFVAVLMFMARDTDKVIDRIRRGRK
jgi:hypothetical protein